MARIIYKPQCSKCGAPITKEVKFIEHDLITRDHMVIPRYDYKPSQCELCGELFDGIEVCMPERICIPERGE